MCIDVGIMDRVFMGSQRGTLREHAFAVLPQAVRRVHAFCAMQICDGIPHLNPKPTAMQRKSDSAT